VLFYAENAIVMPPDQPMVRGRRDIEIFNND
jgi:ketosteroid isomerase-like protein